MESNFIKNLTRFKYEVLDFQRTPEDRDLLFLKFISCRLEKYNDVYEQILDDAKKYILKKNELKVLKTIEREQKREERQNENKHSTGSC